MLSAAAVGFAVAVLIKIRVALPRNDSVLAAVFSESEVAGGGTGSAAFAVAGCAGAALLAEAAAAVVANRGEERGRSFACLSFSASVACSSAFRA